MNIVLTGASGFIGKRLMSKLEPLNLNIRTIDRDTQRSDYNNIFSECDVCFHFAGEVRSNATSEEFFNVNSKLTKDVVQSIKLCGNNTRIIFSSTIHAGCPSNDYGFSKLEAEKIITSYNNDLYLIDCVFRLPHLFGVGAKPDHNSVFTTWVYNAVKGLELNVFDPDFKMTYINVDELVDVFIEQMYSDVKLELPSPYIIKLGDLKDKILSIYNGSACHSKLDRYIFNMLQDAKNNII
ncbi:hypothetical protein BCT09_09245 [Vibrio splendidus]|uniref:NAD-dependent epimerase/dehydratase family protein n=1 Tax=Vibrio splendidus TaxID=29497 RepID=UPI000C82F3F6|nr:NAD-dependent epimerase/dehydratase family protein [Vibrio splendidus]PMO38699.1 hypothetical protein BCT09_09245 [Vibrio splendidus]